jgi:uncharacterized protein (TIGR02466 family)
MDIKFQDLFATRIWLVDLSHLNPYFEEWCNEIKQLRNSGVKPRGASNRMGWNSQPIIMTLPCFKPLLKECIKAFSYSIKTVSPKKEFRYTIKAWANVNDSGGYNTLHNHADALMSGVFYLSVPAGSGNLVLRDPRPGVTLSIFQNVNAPNSSFDLNLKPRVGLLAIFPNWLEHQVEVHQGDTPRISIAMNAQQA